MPYLISQSHLPSLRPVSSSVYLADIFKFPNLFTYRSAAPSHSSFVWMDRVAAVSNIESRDIKSKFSPSILKGRLSLSKTSKPSPIPSLSEPKTSPISSRHWILFTTSNTSGWKSLSSLTDSTLPSC